MVRIETTKVRWTLFGRKRSDKVKQGATIRAIKTRVLRRSKLSRNDYDVEVRKIRNSPCVYKEFNRGRPHRNFHTVDALTYSEKESQRSY